MRGNMAKTKQTGQKLNKKPMNLRLRPWLIILPTLVVTLGILYPFYQAVFYSLTDYSLKKPVWHFVGLKNWLEMFKGVNFWHSLWVTVKYTIAALVVEMGLGLVIALSLNRKDNLFTRILKVVLIFPLMVSPVIATLLFKLMTNSSVGVVERFLNLFGVYGFPWTADSSTALFSVILIDTWVYTPFVLLLILAGLQGLPKSPYESAMIDGGSAWFTFKTLTLPLLKPDHIDLQAVRCDTGVFYHIFYDKRRPRGYPDESFTQCIPGCIHLFQYRKSGSSDLGLLGDHKLYQQ